MGFCHHFKNSCLQSLANRNIWRSVNAATAKADNLIKQHCIGITKAAVWSFAGGVTLENSFWFVTKNDIKVPSNVLSRLVLMLTSACRPNRSPEQKKMTFAKQYGIHNFFLSFSISDRETIPQLIFWFSFLIFHFELRGKSYGCALIRSWHEVQTATHNYLCMLGMQLLWTDRMLHELSWRLENKEWSFEVIGVKWLAMTGLHDYLIKCK